MFSKKNLAVRFAVAVLVSSASFGGCVHAAETNPSGSNYANYVDDKENAGIADRAKSYGTDAELKTATDSDGREYYTPESVRKYQEAAGINVDGMIGPETR
jgi:murein L,D-transpeptidase YcbB/YkuD